MSQELITWVKAELTDRGWSHRELARRAGVSQTAVSGTLSGERNPGADFCIKLAKAFDETPERLLRLAGILPPLPAPEKSMTLGKLWDLVQNMDEEQRLEIYRYARFRYQTDRETEKQAEAVQEGDGE